MDQKVQLIILICASILSLASCRTTSYIQIDVLRPAQKSFSPEIKSLSIVNASHVLVSSDFTNDEQKNTFIFDTLTLHKTVEKSASQLSGSPRFNAVIAIDELYSRRASDFFKPLSWPLVDSFCSKYQSDALLAVEAISFNDTMITYQYFDGISYTRGKNQALIVRSYWNLYNDQSHKIEDSWIQADTLYYNPSDYYLFLKSFLIIPKTRENMASELAELIAAKVALRMAPYWESELRQFYTSSNDDFVKAAQLSYANKWLEAANLWKKNENSPDPKTSAFACYNMALVCEVQGKTNYAIEWLEKSISKYPTEMAYEYLKILKQRLSETVILDSQLHVK